MALRQDRWRAVLSNHLLHEYEEILKAHSPHSDCRSLMWTHCSTPSAPAPLHHRRARRRVDWQKVDAILARVPAREPATEDQTCIVREEPPAE